MLFFVLTSKPTGTSCVVSTLILKSSWSFGKTTEETIEAIKQISSPDYKLPVSFGPFYDKFCYLESGRSSEKVVNTVFKAE